MPRLKTYAAEIDGLHDWVVAAPNQRAALDALGVHQDLFAQGLARVSDDAEAAKIAEAHPGQPLRRPRGSQEPYKVVQAAKLDVWQMAAEAAARTADARRAEPAASPPPPKAPKPPSRVRLDKAEAALAEFSERAAAEMEAIERERAALETRRTRLKVGHAARRARLTKDLEAARSAFRASGGKP